MKLNVPGVFGLLILTTTMLTVCNETGHAVAQPAVQRSKWEYRVLTPSAIEELGGKGTGALAAGLNKLGDDGWELVAIEPGHVPPPVKLSRYVFKRPK